MAAEGSSTAAYTTVAKVKNELLTPPASLTDEIIGGYIDDESRGIDTDLCDYESFADIAASPATPEKIERICRYRVIWRCHCFMGVQNRTDPGSQSMWYLTKANEEVKELQDGVTQIPREAVTSEELTYGSGASGDLMTTEAALAKKNVIPQTVEIVTPSTATIYNSDYKVYYSEGHRVYVYRGLSTLGQAATHVSYEWTYLKQHEVVRANISSGRLLRG